MAELLIGLAATSGTLSTTAVVAGVTVASTSVAVGTVATAGVFGFAGSVTAAGLLQGGLGFFSALASVAGGFAAAQDRKNQALLSDLQADREILKGEAEGLKIKAETIEAIADNITGGSRGALSLTGNFKNIQAELRQRGDRAVRINRINASTNAEIKRIEASGLRSQATGAIVSGLAGGAASLVSVVPRGR